ESMTSAGGRRARRYATPRRFETCEMLADRGLLPAIFFIFSRAGCEAAAGQVVDFGLRLTSGEERRRIRAVAEARTAHLEPADLAVLGFDRWMRGLELGIAPHHAGMVPAFKETVEELFAEGLVRVVFATETLALGINMPARTVVIENLSKFTGEHHELLRPGDYTQLTGRAGRRGIDDAGTAVVLHSRYVEFERVAGIAAAGTHPLVSSFRPSYNMAVNLVATYPRSTAERLLDASFARFSELRRREQLEEQIDSIRAELEAEREAARCELGDVAAVVDEPRARDGVMREFASSRSAGDIIEWTTRGRVRRQVVVARSHGKRPRLVTVDEEGQLHRLSLDRLPVSSVVTGRMDLPQPIRTRDADYRLRVAEDLRGAEVGDALDLPHETAAPPAAACPDLDRHLGALRSVRRLEKRLRRLERRVREAPGGLARRFRAIIELLEARGYVTGWTLSEHGERLRVLYADLDLVLAESLRSDVFADLDAAEVAALASMFTYEPRSGPEAAAYPSRRLAERASVVLETWERLAVDEDRFGLPVTRAPEPGFVELAHRWVGGEGLDDLFEDEAPGVGDFVRNCRQLIDLLRQIRDVGDGPSETLDDAIRRLDRGVVAAAGAL
ncbi:MAG: helicase-related protein, partial [Acidimicrobiia bacterium]|nr:helicase-related protein [Acidimicrobiia bacterium]